MIRTRGMVGAVLIILLLAGTGCCCFRKSDFTALQGKWKGDEIGRPTSGPCYLTIKGQSLDFRGHDTNEWYQGYLTLLKESEPRRADVQINACPMVQYIGKTSHAIFRLDGRTLSITANAPGAPNTPISFDSPDARRFVFTKEQ